MIDREARVFRRMIVLLAAAGASLPLSVAAQTVKVGLINSYTGFVAQPADQGQKGFDLYIKEHAKDLPPGVKIELLRRDDTSNPEVGKRLAQELITRDHVQLLTGIVLSPVATAVAPLTAEAKVPLLLAVRAADQGRQARRRFYLRARRHSGHRNDEGDAGSRPARRRDQRRRATGPSAGRGTAPDGRHAVGSDYFRHLLGRRETAGPRGLSCGVEARMRRQSRCRFILC